MNTNEAYVNRPPKDDTLRRSLSALRTYIEHERFKGYDPYDGLTSPVPLRSIGKWPAILFMQAMKRFPVNLRPVFGIRKTYNPKAMGLLLHAYSSLYVQNPSPEIRSTMDMLFQWLNENRSAGYSGAAWGYPFDWAGKAKMVRAHTPTAVATGFVTRGLYQYHAATGNDEAASLIVSAAGFVLHDLKHDRTGDGLCISYTPMGMDHCYNASLLGAGVLAMAGSLTGKKQYADPARQAVDFVLQRQKPDGRWNYSLDTHTGREREQIDFHQGYVIESLFEIGNLLNIRDPLLETALQNGMAFYKREQFFSDGRSKWRIPIIWPVEIHNQAQGIITFTRLAALDADYLPFARRIAEWTVSHMQDRRGYFYFRKYEWFMNRIPYMRWSQAWMFLALVTCCHVLQTPGKQPVHATPES